MAKESPVTRVELYKNYRASLSDSFNNEVKQPLRPEVSKEITQEVSENPKVNKTQALLEEYEKENAPLHENNEGLNILMIVFGTIIFALLVVAVVFVIGAYKR